jgi:hypothetical protein
VMVDDNGEIRLLSDISNLALKLDFSANPFFWVLFNCIWIVLRSTINLYFSGVCMNLKLSEKELYFVFSKSSVINFGSRPCRSLALTALYMWEIQIVGPKPKKKAKLGKIFSKRERKLDVQCTWLPCSHIFLLKCAHLQFSMDVVYVSVLTSKFQVYISVYTVSLLTSNACSTH